MARIRTLKPEMLADEKLSTLSVTTRFVFVALILLADDKGRLLDNVKTLDGLIFPNTDDSCRESLDTLATMSRITRYTAGSGQKIIQLVNWDRHQKVDKPSKYNLPEPPDATSDSDTASSSVATSSRDSREIPSLRPPTNDHLPPTSDQRPTREKSGRNGSALTADDLKDSGKVIAWLSKSGKRLKLDPESHDAQINALACAEAALEEGDNPPALFQHLMKAGAAGKGWGWKDHHHEAAKRRLREARPAKPIAAVSAVTAKLGATSHAG